MSSEPALFRRVAHAGEAGGRGARIIVAGLRLLGGGNKLSVNLHSLSLSQDLSRLVPFLEALDALGLALSGLVKTDLLCTLSIMFLHPPVSGCARVRVSFR